MSENRVDYIEEARGRLSYSQELRRELKEGGHFPLETTAETARLLAHSVGHLTVLKEQGDEVTVARIDESGDFPGRNLILSLEMELELLVKEAMEWATRVTREEAKAKTA